MPFVNDSLTSYGHVGGFLNVGFISGYARHFKIENGLLKGYIQQTRDTSRMIPVEQSIGQDRFIQVDNEEPVKIMGRIRSRKIQWHDGKRDRVDYHAFLDPVEVSSPSIIEMPTALAWNTAIKGRKPGRETTDDFQPFDIEASRHDSQLREAANTVKVAGIVDQVRSILQDGSNVIVGVEILLRLTADPDALIPVRMLNAGIAKTIRQALRMGKPVMVEGKLRARDLKRIDEDGVEVPTGEQVGYIWCRNILNALRGKHILEIPSWVEEILNRYRREAEESASGEETQSSPVPHPQPAIASSGVESLVDSI